MDNLRYLFPSTSTITSSGYWDPFGRASGIWSDSYFGPGFLEANLYQQALYDPWSLRLKTRSTAQWSGQPAFKNKSDKFHVILNVSHFSPDEIEVSVKDNFLVIHCKHVEKADEYGFIQREFTKRYEIPEGIEAETLKSTLSPGGILLVEAPKKVTEDLPSDEPIIPTEKLEPAEEKAKTSSEE